MASINDHNASEIFQAQLLVYKNLFGFLDSMCLKWAVTLNIPDIIHNHGKPITLVELVSTLQIPPPKVDAVKRLMRYLAHNGLFDIITIHENQQEKEAYALTVASKLLVQGTNLCLSSMVKLNLDEHDLSGAFHHLKEWVYDEEDLTLFEVSSGTTLWEFLNKNPATLTSFNDAMKSDSQMVQLALRNCNSVFKELKSIVDVGGGTGTLGKILCETFPELKKCIVFDLPQVVENMTGSNRLSYVGGDMFKSIPKADAVLLKSILHNWSDVDCIKILEKCKDALPSDGGRGKVIIIECVINEKQDEHDVTQIQLKLDIAMTPMKGKERNKKEWEKLFIQAGFQDYKISPLTGYLFIIEVYP